MTLYIAESQVMKHTTKLALALATTSFTSAVFACASCGCTLSSDWGAQGLSSQAGWSIDVRLDALNQDQLRSGTGTISGANAGQVINPSTGNPAEVEKFTNNRYLTTTLDYNQGETWGVTLTVPYIDRDHSTLGTGSDGTNPGPNGDSYDSHGAGLGDVRVVGRYYGFSEAKNFGIQFGLKLPTGATSQMSNDGAIAVDPGLQLGTGTTDLILGAYYFDNLNQNWDYFVQAQFQSTLANGYMSNGGNGGSYRPGDSVNLTGGLRYQGFETFTPEIQINARNANADSGTIADTYATGGTLVYLTPGVTIPVTDRLSVHTNLQIPIYQNLNGIQLAPTSIFSIGASFKF